MLNNRFAGEALQKIDRLYEAQIPMNGQIVLCKGVNDGRELKQSIIDLIKYIPVMESVSVVPVGLSSFREGLYTLEPFTREDAEQVLALIHHFQDVCMETYGIHFVHASDEWYLLAEQELPKEDNYDGYIQLENGVGMLRLLRTEFAQALKEASDARIEQNSQKLGTTDTKEVFPQTDITIATGLLAAPTIQELVSEFMEIFPEKKIDVVPIINHFFGEQITVSGLLTGQDIVEQLKGRQLGSKLLLPCNLLRSGEEVFLDDMTLAQVGNALQVKIDIVKSSGRDLVQQILNS